MTAGQWQTAWETFNRAVEIPQQDRAAYLRSLPLDSAVLQQVECMLAEMAISVDELATDSRSRTGATVGRYRIGELLGRGGMGEVYAALDASLEREVAIKFLPSKSFTSNLVDRFIREARAASRLNHPNIVTIHDCVQEESTLAIVMERIEGRTLREAISGAAPLNQFLPMARQITAALRAAHDAGIVHRDIKPDNIMVRRDGTVKLLDFGIASLVGAQARAGAPGREVSGALGTLRYMAPELLAGRPATPAADVFSLGVVFFELLTGEQAIKQQIDTITPADPVRRELPPIRRIQPHIPEGLVRLLDSMVATDPSRRPSSADVELRIDRLIAPKPRTGLFTSAAVIAVTLALVLLALIWSRFRSARQESVQAGATRALTRLAGYELDAALAPGGQQFAFVWNGEDNHFNIYSKTLDSSKLTRLTETPAVDINPAWSPDGRSIAFVRLTATSRELMVISAIGGKPRSVLTLRARLPLYIPDALQMTAYSDGPAWTKDGQYLAVTHHLAPQERDSIYLVDLSGSDLRKLTFPEPQTGDYFPSFSPDGKQIAFIRKADVVGRGGIYVLQTSGGKARKIASPAGVLSGLTWISETTLVFSSADRNAAVLWTVPSDGGEVRRLGSTERNGWGPVASNDGRRIVYTIGFRDVGIRYLALTKSSRHPPAARTLLASSGLDNSAQYSPDGNHIVFVSDRSGALEIWKANADGSDPIQLTESNGVPVGSPHWSPDGEQIVYDSVKAGYSAIYVMRADGSGSHLVAAGHEDYMMPTWSHDGRSIYFTVQDRSVAQTRIQRRWLDSGRVVNVVQGRGDVLESADGQTIFFNRTGGQQEGIWKMPASGPPEAATPIVKGVDTTRYESLGQQRLFYLDGQNPPWLIQSYALKTAKTATLFRMDNTPEFGTPSLCISPNEKGIIFSQLEQSGSDVMMWEAAK